MQEENIRKRPAQNSSSKRQVTKNTKKKNSYRWDNILFALCLVAVVMYFSDLFITSTRNSTIQTAIVDFGKVESFQDKSMYVVRNEKVLLAPASGYYELIYPEGERVKKGLPVAKTKNQESLEDYNYLIELLDNRIAMFENNSVQMASDNELSKINNRLEFLYRNVQERVQKGEYDYIDKLKKEIVSLNDKKQYFFPNEQMLSKNELIAEKERLVQEKNNRNSTVYSNMVGLLSGYYDGYESDMSILNIRNLAISKLEKIQNVPSIDYSTEKKQGDPVAVVTENFKWYLVCEVFPEDIEKIVSEKPVYIEIEDKRFVGYLEDFYKGSDDRFVGYFRIEDERFNFYEKRKYQAKVIFESSDGLAIPNEAVVEYNGMKGVFVVDITGVAKFIELVEIDAQNERYTGIRYNPAVQGNAGVVKLYDEVILNPSGIKEGQRIR